MNRFALFATMAVAAALIAPATSLAGGWATVGPQLAARRERSPGEPWVVDSPCSSTAARRSRASSQGAAQGRRWRRAPSCEAHRQGGRLRGARGVPVGGPLDLPWTTTSLRCTSWAASASVPEAGRTRSRPWRNHRRSDGMSLEVHSESPLGPGSLAALFTAALRRRQRGEARRGMRDALAAGLAAAALAFAVVALGVGIDGGDGAPRASPPAEQGPAAPSSRAWAAAAATHSPRPDRRARSGPEPRQRARTPHPRTLIAQITSPAGDGGFSAMPTDFGSRMTARELDSLVRLPAARR